ncbi:MerR family transcriptional regulator [Rubritalea tangerina]|uniref:MerR family transcriptional regulator n=1 Tax=Rubritalea tangerina TaxID=430798 RepID=A0ABW4ZAG7_9BACT
MNLHTMKVVSQQTGLSPHVLRVWEKRYEVVTPQRSDSNRRLYTDEDLRRLSLLAKLTQAGHAIGQIASLPCTELSLLHEKYQTAEGQQHDQTDAALVDKALAAARELDQSALEETFDEAFISFGYSGLLERVMIPFLHKIGEYWQQGIIPSSAEHAASNVVRDYLTLAARPYSSLEGSPRIIVTTPSGQVHELGAVIAASIARKSGWDVTYLGASLPSEEIVGAAIKRKVKAVALSIVYPMDDPALSSDLLRLRKHLPSDIAIMIGGKACANYQSIIEEIGAIQVSSFDQLRNTLDQLRSPS